MSSPIDRRLRDARPTVSEIDAEFTPARQDQILQQVLAANDESDDGTQPLAAVAWFEDPVRRRRVWPLLAAAVAVIAVGALVVPRLVPIGGPSIFGAPPTPEISGTDTSPSASGSSSPSASSSSAPSVSSSSDPSASSSLTPSATPSSTPSPADPSASGGLPGGSAVDLLTQVAENAGKQPPLTFSSTQFLHVVTTGPPLEADLPERVWDQYYANDGWVWMHFTGEINSWDLSHQENPLGTKDMTPAQIKAMLLSWGGTNSEQERVFSNAAELLRGQPFLTPGQRKSLILLLQDEAKHPVAPYPRVPRDPTYPTASPTLTVSTVTLDSGETGYRLFFLDKTGPNPYGEELILDTNGQVPAGYGDVTVTQELVTELPPEFVEKLGTKKVKKSVDG